MPSHRVVVIMGAPSVGEDGDLLLPAISHGQRYSRSPVIHVRGRRLTIGMQIFKHHISLIEGHLKMVDMVRKHTVEGTGNWRMICGLVDRSKEMLRVSKELSWSFVSSVTVSTQSAALHL